MKVATWNIAGGRQYIGHRPEALAYGYDRENLSYFTRELALVKPDIALLQEVHRHNTTGASQSDAIARQLGHQATPAFPYSESHIDTSHQLSLATLSRKPISQTSFYALPHLDLRIVRPNGEEWTSFQPTGFSVSEIEHNGKMITVLNAHLHPFHYFERDFAEPEFAQYRESISQILLAQKDRPTIVAGDFNYADLEKLFPDVFQEGGFREAFQKATTPEKGQQDHILYSHHWDLENAEVKRGFADHYLCIADLSLKP